MKIALLGYGKMGKTIEKVIGEKVEHHHDIILKIDVEEADSLATSELSKADVAIEFTTPNAAYENILKCFKADVPVVSGTTGWLNKYDEVKELCETQGKAFFYASNFSIGVNIFFELNRHLAKMMNCQPQYDVSVHEVHHTEKLDSPSGTAVSIGNDIINGLERKTRWVNSSEHDESELSIVSYREKDVPGIHIVNYQSQVDELEIKHSAKSREGFALGAVMAAEWLIGKKGCFGMQDMLQL